MNRPSRKTSRRQFLSGQSALRAVEDVLPAEEPSGTCVDSSHSPADYLLQIGRAAMACDFDVFLNAGQHPGATEAALAALDLIDQLEAQLTVYRETSEVLEINRLAAQQPVRVESKLFQLLRRAVAIHRETGGAFDMTMGPLSKVWGFFRRAGRFPSREEIDAALAQVGGQWVQLDESEMTIRFDLPTLEINLNAIGKGYALDRAAELLTQRGVTDFLIHGGRSSIRARGSQATDDPAGAGWRVTLSHPLHPERRLAEIRLHDRAIGTSGSGNQFFHFQGQRFGHVIDPRTGYPADRVLSVTVLAPDAAAADALSTAYFVLGVEESLALCTKEPQVAVIFLVPGERSGEVKVVTQGLSDDEFRLLSNS